MIILPYLSISIIYLFKLLGKRRKSVFRIPRHPSSLPARSSPGESRDACVRRSNKNCHVELAPKNPKPCFVMEKYGTCILNMLKKKTGDFFYEHFMISTDFMLMKLMVIPAWDTQHGYYIIWLVVDLTLWKIWFRQLGLLWFPIYGKIKNMFQTTNQ